MDFSFSADDEKFRVEVRQFLSQNLPDTFYCETPDEGVSTGGFSRAYYKKLGEAGYLSLYWPKEYGGRGEPLTRQFILMGPGRWGSRGDFPMPRRRPAPLSSSPPCRT